MAGIYTTLTIIKHLCYFYEITTGQIEFACDGLSALEVVFSSTDISPEDPDGDSVMASRKAWSSSPIQWTTRQFSGYQDIKPNPSLDIWASLNIEADGMQKVASKLPLHNLDILGLDWNLGQFGNRVRKW